MRNGVNHVVIAGELASQIEIMQTKNGKDFARFQLLVSEKQRSKDGREYGRDMSIQINTFFQNAIDSARFMALGDYVCVYGRIEIGSEGFAKIIASSIVPIVSAGIPDGNKVPAPEIEDKIKGTFQNTRASKMAEDKASEPKFLNDDCGF